MGIYSAGEIAVPYTGMCHFKVLHSKSTEQLESLSIISFTTRFIVSPGDS